MKRKTNGILGKHSKKGNVVLETLTVLVVLTIFGIVAYQSVDLWDDIKPDLNSEFTGQANETVNQVDNNLPSTLDGAFVLAFVLLWLFSIVSAYLIDTSPAFFIITIVLFIGVLVAGIFMGDFYSDYLTDGIISGAVNKLPMTTFILEHFVTFLMFIGGTVAIALYAKR